MPRLRLILPSLLLALLAAPPVAAQGFLGRLKDKAKDKIDQHSDDAAQAVVDKADNAVVCAVTDQQCISKAKADGKPVKVTDASGRPVSSTDSAKAVNGGGAAGDPPGKGVWLNYDFIPGDRAIWTEDFSEDQVGDFPSRLQLVDGNFEVVTVNGHNWLHTVDGGTVVAILPEKLPARFTFEVDYIGPNSYVNPLNFSTTEDGAGATWGCYHNSVWVKGGGRGRQLKQGPVRSGGHGQQGRDLPLHGGRKAHQGVHERRAAGQRPEREHRPGGLAHHPAPRGQRA